MPISPKDIVGIIELVTISGAVADIPAKIDTGADSSSIWASDIDVDIDGKLRFKLFAEGSPFYTGEVLERDEFTASVVRSSNGESEVRYKTYFTVLIAGRKVKVKFNLSDRSKNEFKVLIGRRSISGKFLVDVSVGRESLPQPKVTMHLNEELAKNPYEFHIKYVKKGA